MSKQNLPKFVESDNFKRAKLLLQTIGQLVAPGSPEHIRTLEGGYNMTLDQANEIVAARKANPQSFPYEVGLKAQALIAASKATPQVVSTKPPRPKRSEYTEWTPELGGF